ncbi:hypothetical protein V5006_16615, partial [Enterobacter hormaechei]
VANDTNTVQADHFTFSTMVLPSKCEGPLHLHDDVEEVFFMLNGLGNFAGALSPAVMGALIVFTHSMDSGLIFLAVMAAVGCVLLLPLLRRY